MTPVHYVEIRQDEDVLARYAVSNAPDAPEAAVFARAYFDDTVHARVVVGPEPYDDIELEYVDESV